MTGRRAWDGDAWRRAADRAGAAGGAPPSPPGPAGFVAVPDRRYLLRPEAAESLFVLWRVTGRREFREAAWRMFVAVRSATRTPLANAAVEDVTVGDPAANLTRIDSMEVSWGPRHFSLLFFFFFARYGQPNSH